MTAVTKTSSILKVITVLIRKGFREQAFGYGDQLAHFDLVMMVHQFVDLTHRIERKPPELSADITFSSRDVDYSALNY